MVLKAECGGFVEEEGVLNCHGDFSLVLIPLGHEISKVHFSPES